MSPGWRLEGSPGGGGRKKEEKQLTLAHLPDGLVGIATLGSLTRQHHAVSAVSDGVADVANLGASGPGVLDHALKHLGGADDGLASHVAHGDHLLLGSKHLSSGNLDTEVTTGHHDAVSLAQDLGKVVETLSVLDLGNDLDVLALFAEDLPDGLDVLTAADEGGKDHVDIVLDAKAQVILVLLGQSGEIDIGVGQVDTLPRGDVTIVLGTDADGLIVDDVQNLECQDTVVDVDDTTRLDDLGDVLVVDVHVFGVTSSLVLVVRGDVQLGASRDGEIGIAGGVAGPDFLDTCSVLSCLLCFAARLFTYGTLGVQGNGNLAAGLGLFGSAGIVNDGLVVRVLALAADVSGTGAFKRHVQDCRRHTWEKFLWSAQS